MNNWRVAHAIVLFPNEEVSEARSVHKCLHTHVDVVSHLDVVEAHIARQEFGAIEGYRHLCVGIQFVDFLHSEFGVQIIFHIVQRGINDFVPIWQAIGPLVLQTSQLNMILTYMQVHKHVMIGLQAVHVRRRVFAASLEEFSAY